MKRYFCLLVVVLSLFGTTWPTFSYAGNTDSHHQINARAIKVAVEQQLAVEEVQLKNAQSFLSALQTRRNARFNGAAVTAVTKAELAHTVLALSNAKAAVASVRISLADAQEGRSLLEQEVAVIQTRINQHALWLTTQKGKLTAILIEKLKFDLQAQSLVLGLQGERIRNLEQLREVRQNKVILLNGWYKQLQARYKIAERQSVKQQFLLHINGLQKEQQILLQKLMTLNIKVQEIAPGSEGTKNKAAMQFEIFLLQEKITLNRLELFISELKARVEPLTYMDSDKESLSSIDDKLQQLDKVLQHLNNMEGVVNEKLSFVKSHRVIIKEDYQQKLLTKTQYSQYMKDVIVLEEAYQNRLDNLSLFQEKLHYHREQAQHLLKHSLSVRQTLPGFNINAWVSLLSKILVLPVLLLKAFQHFISQCWGAVGKLVTLEKCFLVFVLCGLVVAWYFSLKRLRQLVIKIDSMTQRFSQNVLWVVVKVLKRNLIAIYILLALFFLRATLHVDIRLWLTLTAVFLGYRIATVLARLFLLESVTDVAGKDVSLYRGLRWIFGVGCGLTVLTVLVHYLPAGFDVKSLFNRLFMVLLFVFSLLIFRALAVIPELLQKIFSVRRVYIARAINVFCWLLPITLLINAVIGLAGYVQLAWVIGLVQVIALGVLFGYMAVRGLLIDFMELLYELVIRYVKNGWLWVQVFLKPLDRILRISLFLSMLWILVIVYSLNQSDRFVDTLDTIFHYPLLVMGGNVINVKLLVGILVFISLLAWIGKWSREFSFRWIYVKARDIGLRNSLSVFTQYAVVIVGVIVGLKFLGIDLRGLTVVAAAFAAGIGFGMRDLFSNFFSGILLLAERPFRAGDRITLGQYEGKVVSTGMRSLKIKTWDHMEVIVPNADMFTKPFVNWTHQDSIVRSVVKIFIARVDNPHSVQELIYEVLESFPGVVEDPKPEVFMKEISDTLIEFELRYFINLEVESSRPRVRSAVLFAIWDTFNKNGISPPYPSYNLDVSAKEVKD